MDKHREVTAEMVNTNTDNMQPAELLEDFVVKEKIKRQIWNGIKNKFQVSDQSNMCVGLKDILF